MEKKLGIDAGITCIITKTMRIMRLSVFFTFLFITQSWATSGYSQQARLSLDMKNVRVMEVLNQIEKSSEFFFFFNEKYVNVDRKVDVNVKDVKIEEILNVLFKNTDVNYKVIDKQIILTTQKGGSDALQQDGKKISGKVTDQAGVSLPGASVVVKGTTIGASTDFNGNFTVTVPAGGKTLVISFVGMNTQEMAIADVTDNLIIVLKSDQMKLDEVVVLGYGTSKKRDVIGSVAKISGSEIVSLKSTSLDAALQGSASGLIVNSSAGNPGAASRVLVRGIHSLSLSSDPLFVIDGILVGSNMDGAFQVGGGYAVGIMSTINPNDIESMEVLKDAAATSIYGARGSNGVIIITTKTGKAGVTSSSVDYSQGISTLTRSASDFGLANTQQWFDVTETARANAGLVPVQYDPVVHGGINSVDPTARLSRDQALATQTNWYDQILRTGSFREINFSSTDASKNGTTFVSGNYRRDESPIKNEFVDRFIVRMNVGYNLTKNLKVEARMNGSYINNQSRPDAGAPGGNNNTAAGGFRQAFSNPPWIPVYKPGTTELWNTLSGYNLVASNDPANYRSEASKYRILGVAALTYNIPMVKGLSLRTEGSIDLQENHAVYWTNTVLRRISKYGFDEKYMYRQLAYNIYASFERTFGDHNVNLVTGVETEMKMGETSWLEGEALAGNSQQLSQPATVMKAASYYGINPGGLAPEKSQRGYFGRGNYKFKDRYLVGVSFRRDGTSEFLPEYRWGTFTAFSAGWIMSDENFLKDIKAINFLKLRGSFGQTGNDKIPGGLSSPGYLDWLRMGPRSWLIQKGTTFSSMPVRDVSWETTNSSDFGIDFGVLDNRITGSVAYFNQKVTDLLLAVPIPISAGLFTFGQEGSIWSNIGDMKNFGFEFNANTINYDKNGIKWTTGFNFTTNGTKVLKLNPSLDSQGNGLVAGATTTQIGSTISRTGKKYGAFYLCEFAGIDPKYGYPLIYKADNNIYKLDAAGLPTKELNPNYLHRYTDPATGQSVILPATGTNKTNNRIIFEDKTSRPTFVGGLSNSIEYKGFDLSFAFTFSFGNYLYDDLDAAIHSVGPNFVSNLKDITWTSTNTNVSYPRLSSTNRYDVYDDKGALVGANQTFAGGYNTDQFLVKGDYIRFRTLRLGYEFQKQLVEKMKLQGLTLYLAANNIWTWAKEFKGFDPEIGGGTGMPSMKTFYIGVNIKF